MAGQPELPDGAVPPETFMRAMFPQANQAMRDGTLDIAEAERAALAAIATYVPNAITAFGYGSVFRGRHRPFSDVDVVAFVAESASIANYCFMAEGVAVDLHLVGLNRIDQVIAHARQTGVCSILSAVADGRLLLDARGNGAALRQRLADALADAPAPAQERERRSLRWTITSQLLDLAQDRPEQQVQAAALTAYPMLVRLYHSVRGGWRDRGKWTVRSGEGDERLLTDLVEAYAALFCRGDKAAYLGAAVRILQLDGGPLCMGQGNRLNLDAGPGAEGTRPSATRSQADGPQPA